MKTAYKFEIGSDDCDLTIDLIKSLPTVDVSSLTGLEEIGPRETEESDVYFAEAFTQFTVFSTPEEVLYFVEKS